MEKVENLQAFGLRTIAKRIQGRTARLLMAAAINQFGGLSVTALRRPVNQCDLLESAGWIPLPSLAVGKHSDTFKQGFIVFALYVVDVESESSDLPIHLVRG